MSNMTYKIFGDDLDIFVVHDFLSKEELDYFQNAINIADSENLWEGERGSTKETGTWSGRNFPLKQDQSPILSDIYARFIDFFSENIREIPENKLYECCPGLGPINRTREGEFLPAHDDLGPPELEAPMLYGVVLYLNDDYLGGELYYEYLDIEIKPTSGMLVIHSADKRHTHGVRTVTSGTRYGITMFVKNPDKV